MVPNEMKKRKRKGKKKKKKKNEIYFCVGLATFKDTFWSSETNPDHPFYYDCMIGEDVTDPNIPWTVRKKSNCTYIPSTYYLGIF
jgi:hypothetical protein